MPSRKEPDLSRIPLDQRWSPGLEELLYGGLAVSTRADADGVEDCRGISRGCVLTFEAPKGIKRDEERVEERYGPAASMVVSCTALTVPMLTSRPSMCSARSSCSSTASDMIGEAPTASVTFACEV